MTIEDLLRRVTARAGASEAAIQSVERGLGRQLPADYAAFLRRSDGVEGFIVPGAYLMLWSTSEIAPLNVAYSVEELMPGMTLLGTDGGGTGYGFTQTAQTAQYVAVPLIGLGFDEVRILGDSFAAFLDRLQISDA